METRPASPSLSNSVAVTTAVTMEAAVVVMAVAVATMEAAVAVVVEVVHSYGGDKGKATYPKQMIAGNFHFWYLFRWKVQKL